MTSLWEIYKNANQIHLNQELLECSICKQLLSPPVYLHDGSGNVCKDCKRVKKIDAIRNKPLDIALANTFFPCKYVANGCDELLPSKNLHAHQLFCHYAPIKCPNCGLEAFESLEHVIEHCASVHELKEPSQMQIELKEYNPEDGVKISLFNLPTVILYIAKVVQEQADELNIIVCCPLGVPINQDLYVIIRENSFQMRVKVNIVECFNMLNSTDEKHVTVVPLTSLHQTSTGCTSCLGLEFIFNKQDNNLQLSSPENFRKDVECPICFNLYTGAVYKCLNAHNVCSACIPLINRCPICREKFDCAPDYKMENLLHQIVIYCTNKVYGCEFVSDLKTLKEHENTCVYRPFNCPIQDCEFVACYLELVQHYKQSHNLQQNGSKFTINLDYAFSASILFMNHIFSLESSLEGNNYTWGLTLVISNAMPWQFIFDIKVLNLNNEELISLTNSCGNKLTLGRYFLKDVLRVEDSMIIQCFIRMPTCRT